MAWSVRQGRLARLDEARRAMPLAAKRGTHQHRWRKLCAAGGSPQGDSVPHRQRRIGNYPMLMRARCRIGLINRYFICFDPREAKKVAPHCANPAGHFSFCLCVSCARAAPPSVIDYLVGLDQTGSASHLDPKRLCASLNIDHQFELRGLLNWVDHRPSLLSGCDPRRGQPCEQDPGSLTRRRPDRQPWRSSPRDRSRVFSIERPPR